MKKQNNVGASIAHLLRRNQKGITVIVLVITIIVLLILAGIVISLTIRENGIITNEAENIINGLGGSSNEIAQTTETRKITEIVEASDYGKTINYSVTVDGITLNDWKVFYNDGTNVYIILGDYLNNLLIPTSTGMTTTGTYQAYWASGSVADNTEAVATLTNTENWSAFATGTGAQSATGGPTNEMFVASWNANPNTNATILTEGSPAYGLTDSTGLYIPHTSIYEGCYGYWLASPSAVYAYDVWYVYLLGYVDRNYFHSNACGVRPIVCLTSDVTGTVGDSNITIDS